MVEDGIEPWLRGTLTDVPVVQRAVLHALELAAEDIEKWCRSLSDEQLNARPEGIAPVAFHLRHIARSLDRLLTYAEGRELTAGQFAALKTEMAPAANRHAVFSELAEAFPRSASRIRAVDSSLLDTARKVGKRQLPTTTDGLLIHIAEHTQRHVGQAITTSKIVRGTRSNSEAGN
jgi:uncharacterized damage-inducible protein DinB